MTDNRVELPELLALGGAVLAVAGAMLPWSAAGPPGPIDVGANEGVGVGGLAVLFAGVGVFAVTIVRQASDSTTAAAALVGALALLAPLVRAVTVGAGAGRPGIGTFVTAGAGVVLLSGAALAVRRRGVPFPDLVARLS
jgi:hypothetical protein